MITALTRLHFRARYTRRTVQSALLRALNPVKYNPDARIVIGIRYSVFLPEKQTWRIAKQSPEAYRNMLFSQARLNERYRLFTSITLPSLLAQTLPMKAGLREVNLYVSETLPSLHLMQLQTLANQYDWLSIVSLPETATEYPTPPIEHCYASIRLDDDDALADWFMERISGYVQPAYEGWGITFPKGIAATVDGMALRLHGMWEPKVSVGLTYIAGPHTKYASIYELGAHTSVQKNAPLVMDPLPNAYLRTVHAHQDTNVRPVAMRSLPVSFLAHFGLEPIEEPLGRPLPNLEVTGPFSESAGSAS